MSELPVLTLLTGIVVKLNSNLLRAESDLSGRPPRCYFRWRYLGIYFTLRRSIYILGLDSVVCVVVLIKLERKAWPLRC